mmetsp:Transcript_25807/g.62173  ORF Transcript_25807/g.62173 Transcript_25807/m.62173 type:complete len:83 (+) Transcript_25807:256-504(+)
MCENQEPQELDPPQLVPRLRGGSHMLIPSGSGLPFASGTVVFDAADRVDARQPKVTIAAIVSPTTAKRVGEREEVEAAGEGD